MSAPPLCLTWEPGVWDGRRESAPEDPAFSRKDGNEEQEAGEITIRSWREQAPGLKASSGLDCG